jgi:hypothetical protein
MASKYASIYNMFDYIEQKINKETGKRKKKQTVGGDSEGDSGNHDRETEPFYSFKTSINNVYDYFSVIFKDSNAKEAKFKKSVLELDKQGHYTEDNINDIELEENTVQDTILENTNENDSDSDNDVERKESQLLLKDKKILI